MINEVTTAIQFDKFRLPSAFSDDEKATNHLHDIYSADKAEHQILPVEFNAHPKTIDPTLLHITSHEQRAQPEGGLPEFSDEEELRPISQQRLPSVFTVDEHTSQAMCRPI